MARLMFVVAVVVLVVIPVIYMMARMSTLTEGIR